MKHSIFYVFAFVLFFQISCTKDQDSEPGSQAKEEEILNHSYGSDPRQKMDVYLPEGRTESTPFVIIIHGGSWVEGNKEDMRFVQQELVKQGVASANINYRYAALDHHYDSMMDDISAAIAVVQDQASAWIVREKQYAMLGYSAGGHLALLYAYGFKKPQEIKTVISVAGPTDLKTLQTDPVQNILLSTVLIGILPSEFYTHSKTNDASPLFHANKAVSTLMIHGTADEVVPFSQSEKLLAALRQKDIAQRLVALEGTKHDVTANPLYVLKILAESSAWIRNQGK